MKSQKKYMIGLLLLLSLGPRVVISTPIEDFYSDEYLHTARAYITKMNLKELESFISYLASCGANFKSDVQQFSCERDKALFEMKYIHRNELTSLMNTLQVVEIRLESLDSASAGSDERKELTKLLFRASDISNSLKEVATVYYSVATRE